MPQKKFVIVLKGTDGGQLTNVTVTLGGKDVPLGSGNSVIWRNDDFDIRYTEPLSIYYKVEAISGTTWDISIKQKGAEKPCYTNNGTTGSDAEPNVSEKLTTGDC